MTHRWWALSGDQLMSTKVCNLSEVCVGGFSFMACCSQHETIQVFWKAFHVHVEEYIQAFFGKYAISCLRAWELHLATIDDCCYLSLPFFEYSFEKFPIYFRELHKMKRGRNELPNLSVNSSTTVTPRAHDYLAQWLSALANGHVILSTACSNYDAIDSWMKALLGHPLPALAPLKDLNPGCVGAMRNVLSSQKNYWKSLRFDRKLPARSWSTTRSQ